MKILHIFGVMNYGGAELRTLDVMREIDREKYSFEFLSASGECGLLDKEIEALNGRVHKINIYSPFFIFKFLKLVIENKYDIIHSHIHYVSGYIMFLSFICNVKQRITHFRSSGLEEKNYLVKVRNKVLKRMIRLFSTDIVAVNKSTMKRAWKEDFENEKKCKVIYNGINKIDLKPGYIDDLRKELMIPKNYKIIIHVGRLNKAKNHEKIISVFEEYNRYNDKSVLLLIGEDKNEYGEKIKSIISKNIENSVRFLGNQDNVHKYYAIADAMIFPSIREGLPGAVLEALSMGTPVLASDIDCNEEINGHIPSIETLSLNYNDILWAQKLKNIIDTKDRNLIINEFMQSPYHISGCVEQFMKLYKMEDMVSLNG